MAGVDRICQELPLKPKPQRAELGPQRGARDAQEFACVPLVSADVSQDFGEHNPVHRGNDLVVNLRLARVQESSNEIAQGTVNGFGIRTRL